MAISMGAVLVFVMLTLWSVVAVELLNGLAHDQELVVWWDEQKCDRCPKAGPQKTTNKGSYGPKNPEIMEINIFGLSHKQIEKLLFQNEAE